MLPTIIVGAIFAAIITWAALRSKKDLKTNKCAGCGVQGCSDRKA